MALEPFNANVANPDIDEPIWSATPNPNDIGTTVFGQRNSITPGYRGTGSFLGDILGDTGWYSRQPGSTVRGGGPSTEQEKNFILDFMLQNQRAPNMAEIGQWKQGVDTSKDVYIPEGLMGQMGFKTQKEYSEAQSRGEIYGGHDFSQTTPGQMTITGQPITTPSNKPMSVEEALASMGVSQSYSARLSDYLQQRIYEDQPKLVQVQNELDLMVQELQKDVDAGNITKDEANRRLEAKATVLSAPLISKDKAEEIQTIAEGLLNRGYSAEDTMRGISDRLMELGYPASPDLTASLTTIGPAAAKLWQDLIAQQKEAAKYEENRRALAREPVARVKREPEFEPRTEPKQATGNEYNEYIAYVQSLKLPREYSSWMANEYQNMIQLWQESEDRVPFIVWLKNYLQKGG